MLVIWEGPFFAKLKHCSVSHEKVKNWKVLNCRDFTFGSLGGVKVKLLQQVGSTPVEFLIVAWIWNFGLTLDGKSKPVRLNIIKRFCGVLERHVTLKPLFLKTKPCKIENYFLTVIFKIWSSLADKLGRPVVYNYSNSFSLLFME